MSADDSEPLGSWLATLVVPVFFSSGVIVRIISGIFVRLSPCLSALSAQVATIANLQITLGIAFLAPIVSLITFDICLWLWRLYSLSRNAFLRRQRLIREEQRERRQLLQQQLQKQKQQKLQSLQKQREAQPEVVTATATATATATPAETTTRRL